MSVNENVDKVTFDGKPVSKEAQLCYILLNKPTGYVTTLSDELGRKQVTDLIPEPSRIFPVGRLDLNTEGLLLFTNDGELSYHLTHPKFLIDKTYRVKINRDLTFSDMKKLEQGVMLEDGITSSCEVQYENPDQSKKIIIMSIHEGRKRQIRRMFEALNYKVTRLKRIRFANLSLQGLPTAKWRYLTDQEIRELKKMVKLS
jgi:23S rRNA pseudouridine2605 synthase